jgi:hypothetical protein
VRRNATAASASASASASAQIAQDGVTCAHERIPELKPGEKTAKNNDRFARERSSYKQKVAWKSETCLHCATRTSKSLFADCSLYQETGEKFTYLKNNN